ncbi:hypothetical protein KTR66_15365 [Roseococcus sp. SDR]|uniref:hypothetical protein n=1 Tax=Roseococcus sp. SDR TaxID=2835532 RepID=UPI001BCC24D6|nr:hypothetical protein [Roseococcus sp. SDR]MBS7791380.1 hypothetical protein [Roseococcus sp. SDR]MBV1846694.1 hypothetical protein [Roseococcus sp. SDR]
MIVTAPPRLPAPPILRIQAAAGRETAPLPEDWTAFKRRYVAPDGQVSAGFGIELDDAEREARRVCGAGAACQVIIAGC